MVGPLKRFKRDPNGLGRGPGLYYHRGHGYYSKYHPSRDALHRKKVKKKLNSAYRHTADRKKYKRPFGWV